MRHHKKSGLLKCDGQKIASITLQVLHFLPKRFLWQVKKQLFLLLAHRTALYMLTSCCRESKRCCKDAARYLAYALNLCTCLSSRNHLQSASQSSWWPWCCNAGLTLTQGTRQELVLYRSQDRTSLTRYTVTKTQSWDTCRTYTIYSTPTQIIIFSCMNHVTNLSWQNVTL